MAHVLADLWILFLGHPQGQSINAGENVPHGGKIPAASRRRSETRSDSESNKTLQLSSPAANHVSANVQLKAIKEAGNALIL